MRRHRVFICLTVMLMFLVGSALSGDSQGWINNSLTFKINDSFSLKLSNETRCNELTYSDSYLKNWQGGIVFNLSKNLYLAAFYKREDSRKTGYFLHENRYTLESGWKTKLASKLNFDLRFRMEIRDYQYDKSKDNLRFRLRARIKTEMKICKFVFSPFLAIEPFGDTVVDEINRYRFYAGVILPVCKNAGFVVNYIRQGTRDKETVHILNSGVELKF